MRPFLAFLLFLSTTFTPACYTTSRLAEAAITRSPVAIRLRLKEHRHQQIARLHAYAAAGVFPSNRYSIEPLHQLRDPQGTLCAVANLVHLDGHDDVLDAMVKTNNAVLIGEVKDGPLYAWVLTSGLTQEEVGRIQAPAPFRPIEQENDEVVSRLRGHFAQVEQEIVAEEEDSLDLATGRLVRAQSEVLALAER